MSKNQNLHNAKNAKNDEFYTQLADIENELKHYKEYFCGKVVLCNCDDPYESNFFKYFALNFNHLGIKKLICTCYDSSPIVGEQLELLPGRKPYKIEISEVLDHNGDGAVDLSDVEYLLKNKKNILAPLRDGDFRSEECIKLLRASDIVVTNPPFSLFREYVAQLIEYDKKFIIIGNVNAITYKEIFPLLKDNKVWLGISIHSGDREFRVPDSYPLNASGCRIDEQGNRFIRVKGVRWYTNLDTPKRHEELLLYKQYNPDDYPHYDNYDAINVDKVVDIPCDWCESWGITTEELKELDAQAWDTVRFSEENGKTIHWVIPAQGTPLRLAMHEQREGYREAIEQALSSQMYCSGAAGVPITFMDKHNKEQFDIVGADFDLAEKVDLGNGKFGTGRFYVEMNGTEQNRTEQNRTEQNRTEQNRTEQNRTEQNRTKRLYSRIIIKRKL